MFRAVFVPAGLLLEVSGHVLGCFCARRVTFGGLRACFGQFSCPQGCYWWSPGMFRSVFVPAGLLLEVSGMFWAVFVSAGLLWEVPGHVSGCFHARSIASGG